MEKLGKQGVWRAEIDGEGGFKVAREDGKFFEIGIITTGYDRPVIVNFGQGVTSVVLVNGKVTVEDEKLVISLAGDQMTQKRVLRASADNPNFVGIPLGEVVGANRLDSQRIIYEDGVLGVQTLASATTETPLRKVNGQEVACEVMSIKDFASSADGPGKVALFDVMAAMLTAEELTQIFTTVGDRIMSK
ncbi:MAG: hypothetical protein Q8P53_02590 [Candidatus Shapirobacteria bacterium]|nr:hypothetical protein [Candidatus Shapirobacteria bacterium]